MAISNRHRVLEGLDEPTKVVYKRLFCAAYPVSEGIRPGVLTHLRTDVQRKVFFKTATDLKRLLKIQMKVLHDKDGDLSILLYSDRGMGRVLNSQKTRCILTRAGYTSFDVLTALEILKNRYSFENYPHEIGLFLGYPPGDVEGFIKNGGRNCLMCRHWKVYDNVSRAKALFEQIDSARVRASKLAAAL